MCGQFRTTVLGLGFTIRRRLVSVLLLLVVATVIFLGSTLLSRKSITWRKP
jgi:hypothetical protein